MDGSAQSSNQAAAMWYPAPSMAVTMRNGAIRWKPYGWWRKGTLRLPKSQTENRKIGMSVSRSVIQEKKDKMLFLICKDPVLSRQM